MSSEPPPPPPELPPLLSHLWGQTADMYLARLPYRVLLRRSIACMALSLLAGLGVAFTPGPLPCLSWFLGAPLALGGVILAAKALRRPREQQANTAARSQRLGTGLVLALGIFVLLAQTWLGLAGLSNTREVAKSAVTLASLRGIGEGIAIYARECGQYPASLDDLVTARIATPKQLVSIWDPEGREPPYYSSFIYRPGCGPYAPDPALVIAFERTETTRTSPAALLAPGRAVLFGDAHVECLREQAFHEALRSDRERRAQLGWPVPNGP